MLRGKSTGHVGTIGIGRLGGSRLWHANYVVHDSDAADSHNLAGAFSLLVAMVTVPLDLPAFIDAEVPNGRTHGVGVTFVPISENGPDRSIYGACCLFSGDQPLISDCLSIGICGGSAWCIHQGVHLHRRSVLDELRHDRGVT